MSNHRDEDRLRRSLAALTFAPEDDGRVQEQDRPGEFEQRIQVPIQGIVGNDPHAEMVTVYFEHPFAMRLSDDGPDDPHFSYGVALSSGYKPEPPPPPIGND